MFVRQVLLQVEKYQLYKVFSDDYFDEVLSTREKYKRGEYIDIAAVSKSRAQQAKKKSTSKKKKATQRRR